jgi:hypothetical protein
MSDREIHPYIDADIYDAPSEDIDLTTVVAGRNHARFIELLEAGTLSVVWLSGREWTHTFTDAELLRGHGRFEATGVLTVLAATTAPVRVAW